MGVALAIGVALAVGGVGWVLTRPAGSSSSSGSRSSSGLAPRSPAPNRAGVSLLNDALQADLKNRAQLGDSWATWAERGAKWGESFGILGVAIGAALGAFVGEAMRILGERQLMPPLRVLRNAARDALRRQGVEPTEGDITGLIHAAVLSNVFYPVGFTASGDLCVRSPRPGRRIGAGQGVRLWENFLKGWLYDPVATWAAANRAGSVREVREQPALGELLGFGGVGRPGGQLGDVIQRWYIPPDGVYRLVPVASAPAADALAVVRSSGLPGFACTPLAAGEQVVWGAPSAVPGAVQAHLSDCAAVWT